MITGYDNWEAWPAGTVNALTITNNVFFPTGPEPTGKRAIFVNGTYKSFRQVRKTPSWPRSWANLAPFTAVF